MTYYVLYLVVFVALMTLYLRRHKKKERVHAENLRQSIAAGLSEPQSLHPVIDPLRCIGRTAPPASVTAPA
jgi:hypothetical protein